MAHPVESDVVKVGELAHVRVRNVGTREVFLSEILRIVGTADELHAER
jgi:hypothetical protein